jgi:hypothetical protein
MIPRSHSAVDPNDYFFGCAFALGELLRFA